MEDLHVEGAPTDGQKERLDDFLTELMLLTRKYRILLRDNSSEGMEIIDMPTGHLIGLGLSWFTAATDERHIIAYVPSDSILDGVWPVDGPDGFAEQRHVTNVNPLREPPT